MKTLSCGCLVIACLLSSCASPNSTETDAASNPANDSSATDYVKPGAAITFSHTPQNAPAVSETGHLKITVGERYDSGTIDISVTGSEGLEIFATSTRATFDAADTTDHNMHVYYSANADGKYYINLIATAPNGQVRTHAISVLVGDESKAAEKLGDVVNETDSEGNPIIVMEADEKIE